MARYTHRFDVRRFGAKPRYVNPTNRGRDNGPAFADCAGELSIQKATGYAQGGQMYVPPSEYGYWMGYGPDPVVLTGQFGLHILGGGKRASRLIYEPEGAPLPGQDRHRCIQWKPTSGTTGQGSASGITVYGFNDEYVGTRQPKAAFATIDGTEMVFADVSVNNWQSNTGTVSECFSGYGKEIHSFVRCSFYGDRPVGLHANPTEPSISADGYHFHDSYLGVFGSGEAGVHIDPGLNVLNFHMSGVTNIVGHAGAKYAIYWDDPTGTQDTTGFKISGAWRAEQFVNDTGANIYINRGGTGRLYGLSLSNMNLNFGTRGIVLRGVIGTTITDCDFLRFTGPGVSALAALDISATCEQTTVRNFRVPSNALTSVVTTGQTVTFTTGDTPAGYRFPTMINYHP